MRSQSLPLSFPYRAYACAACKVSMFSFHASIGNCTCCLLLQPYLSIARAHVHVHAGRGEARRGDRKKTKQLQSRKARASASASASAFLISTHYTTHAYGNRAANECTCNMSIDAIFRFRVVELMMRMRMRDVQYDACTCTCG